MDHPLKKLANCSVFSRFKEKEYDSSQNVMVYDQSKVTRTFSIIEPLNRSMLPEVNLHDDGVQDHIWIDGSSPTNRRSVLVDKFEWWKMSYPPGYCYLHLCNSREALSFMEGLGPFPKMKQVISRIAYLSSINPSHINEKCYIKWYEGSYHITLDAEYSYERFPKLDQPVVGLIRGCDFDCSGGELLVINGSATFLHKFAIDGDPEISITGITLTDYGWVPMDGYEYLRVCPDWESVKIMSYLGCRPTLRLFLQFCCDNVQIPSIQEVTLMFSRRNYWQVFDLSHRVGGKVYEVELEPWFGISTALTYFEKTPTLEDVIQCQVFKTHVLNNPLVKYSMTVVGNKFYCGGDLVVWSNGNQTPVYDSMKHLVLLTTEDPGYCYLNLTVSPIVKKELARLGPYPLLKDVIENVVFYEAYRNGLIIERVKMTISNDVFHLEQSNKTSDMLITSLLIYYLSPKGKVNGHTKSTMMTARVGSPSGYMWFMIQFVFGYTVTAYLFNLMGLTSSWDTVRNVTDSISRLLPWNGWCYLKLTSVRLGRYPRFCDVLDNINMDEATLAIRCRCDNDIWHCGTTVGETTGYYLRRYNEDKDNEYFKKPIGYESDNTLLYWDLLIITLLPIMNASIEGLWVMCMFLILTVLVQVNKRFFCISIICVHTIAAYIHSPLKLIPAIIMLVEISSLFNSMGRCYEVLCTEDLGSFPLVSDVIKSYRYDGPYGFTEVGGVIHVHKDGSYNDDETLRYLCNNVDKRIGFDLSESIPNLWYYRSPSPDIIEIPSSIDVQITNRIMSLYWFLGIVMMSLQAVRKNTLSLNYPYLLVVCYLWSHIEMNAWSILVLIAVLIYGSISIGEDWCPTITIFTFGSKGDTVPLRYYEQYLSSLGLNVSQVDHFNDKMGSLALKEVENNNCLVLTRDLAELTETVENYLREDNSRIALLPNHGVEVRGRVAYYALSPPPSEIKSWMLSSGKWYSPAINVIFRLLDIMSDPDIRIGSFRGCAPRSCDGSTLLTIKPNKGTRDILIALGSSSLEEPPDLKGDVWSTRPDTRYKYEPRTNHGEMMTEYKTVYCHGGAGTMATAASCGCKVIPLSTLLDRNYVENPAFVFKSDPEKILYMLISTFTGKNQLFVLYRLLIAGEVRAFYGYLARCLIMHFRCLLCLCTLIKHNAFAVYYSLDSLTIGSFIVKFLTYGGQAINPFLLVVVVVIVKCVITTRRKRDMLRMLTQHTKTYINGLLNQRTLTWYLWLGEHTGYGLGIVLINIYKVLCNKYHTTLIKASLNMIYYFASSKHLSRDTIQIRYIILDGVLGYLPTRHVEFVNPRTNECMGITAVKKDIVRCEYYENYNNREGRVYSTNCPIEHWGVLKEKMKSKDGKVYHAFMNCQWSAYLALRKEDQYSYIGFQLAVLMLFSGILIMVFGVALLLVIFGSLGLIMSTALYASAMPILNGNGDIQGFLMDFYDLIVFLFSPVTTVLPLVNETTSDYNTKLVKVEVNGKYYPVMKPDKWCARREYSLCRDYEYLYPHSLTKEAFDPDPVTTALSKSLNIPEYIKGKVAVTATTAERIIPRGHIENMLNYHDHVIVLSDKMIEIPGCLVIQISCSGRMLAYLRCCMPEREGTTWYVYNASKGNGVPYEYLMSILNISADIDNSYDFGSAMWYGVHQSSCSNLWYRRNPLESQLNGEIYGSDEVLWRYAKGICYCQLCPELIHQLSTRIVDFQCERTIRVFKWTKRYHPIVEYDIDDWNWSQHIKGLKSRKKGPILPVWFPSRTGISINGTEIPLGPILSNCYKDDTRDGFLKGLRCNSAHTLAKIAMTGEKIAFKLCRELLSDEEQTFLKTAEQILAIMQFPSGSPTVRALGHYVKQPRLIENSCYLHPNPTFIDATFDETLGYVLGHLSSNGPYTLKPHVFIRNVNRNPHVDLMLRQRAHDMGAPDGVDGQVIACREIVINSLARYYRSSTLDSLLESDITDVVDALVSTKPGLYANARIADPKKLLNHFLKRGNYSAGIPFIGITKDEPTIKKRKDLKKEKWLKPIALIGLDPYITGKWYPGLAHAFTKSQVVEREKLVNNPAKVRTVVATSVVNNIQQGVLHFDINNRHAPHSGPSKVGITLNGRALGAVFEELSMYKHATSLDATAFDSTLSNTVFQMEAAVRKYGYKDHIMSDIINKHIDCAMKQTQTGYIVNLVKETWEEVCKNAEGECKTMFNLLSPELQKEYENKYKEFSEEYDCAPGGVIHKQKGGCTGDSNTTFTNTIGLEVVLIYSVCKAQKIKPSTFFSKYYLANTGDDNVLGHNDQIDFNKVFQIARKTFGVEFRIESSSDHILGQTFLGKIPVEGTKYLNDFMLIGLEPPKFAVIHERKKLLMRYANFKADAQKNFKKGKTEIYLIQKGIGYLNLTAHQPEIYELIKDDLLKTMEKVSPKFRNKGKLKLPSYHKVLKDWYKLGSLETLGEVNMLQFTSNNFVRTEIALDRLARFCSNMMDLFPSELAEIRDVETDDMPISDGVFESHAWHVFVAENQRPPTISELKAVLRVSPYASLCNVEHWYNTEGCGLPIEGELFENNLNYSVAKHWYYTSTYFFAHNVVSKIGRFPFGNVALEVLNLSTYKSSKFAHTMNHLHYVGTGRSNSVIARFAGRDCYKYVKRFSCFVTSKVRLPTCTGWLPWYATNNSVAKALDYICNFTNVRVSHRFDRAQSEVDLSNEWANIASQCLDALEGGRTVTVSAPTGSGKTRYLPGMVLSLSQKPVIVIQPRRLLCEQFASYNKCSYVRKGERQNTSLATCTYGYLAALEACGKLREFVEGKVLIFDEAHEISLEWTYIRDCFLKEFPSILLTATPTKDMMMYTHLKVDVETPFKIKKKKVLDAKLDQLVEGCIKKYKRILIIHPTKRFVNEYARKNKRLGFTALTADQRVVPESGHIVATSIVDAGITIPDLDCVIDCGLRIVNNKGSLLLVPIDTATSLQRMGRTGRTTDGAYFLMTETVDKSYTPAPDVLSILSETEMSKHFRINNALDKPKNPFLNGDNFAYLAIKLTSDIEKSSVSLYHKLVIKYGQKNALSVYKKVKTGTCSDEDYYLFEISLCVSGCLIPETHIVNLYNNNRPYYMINGVVVSDNFSVYENTLVVKELDHFSHRVLSDSKASAITK